MDRDKASVSVAIISGVFAVIAALISGILTTRIAEFPSKIALNATPTSVYAPIATYIPFPFATMTALSIRMTPTSSPTPIFFPTNTPLPTMTPIPQSVPTQIAMIQSEVTSLRQQVDGLSKAVASNPNPDIAGLRSDLKSLDSRLAVIEKAVLDNPERALQLTLLSRDMDNLKTSNKTDAENTRQEIARVYDLTKWFIGLMFTIALSVVGLAVSNFIKKPEKVTEKLWTPSKKE